MEARQEIETIVNEAIKNKKMATRKLGAKYLMHDSTSTFESMNPLQKAQRPVKTAKAAIPVELPDGLDDHLPRFDFKDLPNLDLVDEEVQP